MTVAELIEALRDCGDHSAEVRFVCHYGDFESALTVHEVNDTPPRSADNTSSVLYLLP